jgi:hypothetical protein
VGQAYKGTHEHTYIKHLVKYGLTLQTGLMMKHTSDAARLQGVIGHIFKKKFLAAPPKRKEHLQ